MIAVIKEHKTFNGVTKFCDHASALTGTKMRFSLFLPPGDIKGCVIWLSGLTCNEENFITKAGAQQHLAAHGLMVACPDTSPRGLNLPGEHDRFDFGSGAGFYLDATVPGYRDHYRMYSYITDEFHKLVTDEYGVSGKISIMGHSMGGHGALVMALREPEKYRAVSVFAPLSNPTRTPWGRGALRGYLADDETNWKQYDACELLNSGHRFPGTLLIDQGDSDPYLHDQLMTESLIAAAASNKQPAEYRLRGGYDHSYYYISTFIGEHIAFHASLMQKAP